MYILHPIVKEPVITQMLIDDKFDLKVRVPNLRLAMDNIRKAGFNLQADFDSGDDTIPG